MKIMHYLYEGDSANAWMGLCWYDHERRAHAIAPIGLNVLIVLGVKARNWLAVELPRRMMPTPRRLRTRNEAIRRLKPILHQDRLRTLDQVTYVQRMANTPSVAEAWL